MKQISIDNVLSTYRFYAPLYDLLFGRVLEPGRREMIRYVKERNPKSILEVGVGTGLTIASYPKADLLVGVDVSGEMLERAQEKAEKLKIENLQLKLMNGESMEFADHSFDCVTVPYVLSVTPDPARFIKEVRRVCKPGGEIIILNHFSGSRFWWILERLVRTFADKVGFRSDFSYEEQILTHDWQVKIVKKVNLFGLSKLVVIEN